MRTLGLALMLGMLISTFSTRAGERQAGGETGENENASSIETPGKLILESVGDDMIKANLRAPIVVFDIFNMYCAKCQKKAPKTEAFHQLINKRNLTEKILFIGIATQNTNYEAAVFMKKFNLTFTVYSDRNSAYYELLNSKKWPWFVVMKRVEGDRYKVVYRGKALDGTPEEFLNKILEVCE